ncbi:MAG: hypothetical protein QM582_15205, partial [Micropruina sp.]|uniref:hypothetical protein n=1 Tax=Micropruina sp. TaxID=2737536 RepID=UPI0039E57081
KEALINHVPAAASPAGDLRPPKLAPYVQYAHKIWGPQLIPPGTSSLGTALISASLTIWGSLSSASPK